MRIYMAAPMAKADEVNHYADSLRWAGHKVETAWSAEDDRPSRAVDNARRPGSDVESAAAPACFEAVSRADVLICFPDLCGPGVSPECHHVELDLARTWRKHIFVVGLRLNDYHLMGEVQHFPCWGQDILNALEELW